MYSMLIPFMRIFVIASDTRESVKGGGIVEILLINYVSLVSEVSNTLISAEWLTSLKARQCHKHKAHTESVKVCKAGLSEHSRPG